MNFSLLHRQMAASKLVQITEQHACLGLLQYNQTKLDNIKFTLSALKDLAVMLDLDFDNAAIASSEVETISNCTANMHYALISKNEHDFSVNFYRAVAIMRKHFWQLQNEMAEA